MSVCDFGTFSSWLSLVSKLLLSNSIIVFFRLSCSYKKSLDPHTAIVFLLLFHHVSSNVFNLPSLPSTSLLIESEILFQLNTAHIAKPPIIHTKENSNNNSAAQRSTKKIKIWYTILVTLVANLFANITSF